MAEKQKISIESQALIGAARGLAGAVGMDSLGEVAASLILGQPIGAAIMAGGALAAGAASVGKTMFDSAFSPTFAPKVVNPTNGNYSFLNMGAYAIALNVKLPVREDMITIDRLMTQNGISVNEYVVPRIVPDEGEEFVVAQTHKAAVACRVRQAAVQMASMLDAGTRFWADKIG